MQRKNTSQKLRNAWYHVARSHRNQTHFFKQFLVDGTNRCVECLMHVWYALVYFSYFLEHWPILGYLLEKGAKKGGQKSCQPLPKMEAFWSESEHRAPFKETWIFSLPWKRHQSGILPPHRPKGCPKGNILEVFWVSRHLAFTMLTQTRYRSLRIRLNVILLLVRVAHVKYLAEC